MTAGSMTAATSIGARFTISLAELTTRNGTDSRRVEPMSKSSVHSPAVWRSASMPHQNEPRREVSVTLVRLPLTQPDAEPDPGGTTEIWNGAFGGRLASSALK